MPTDPTVPAPELAAAVAAITEWIDANVQGFKRQQIPDSFIASVAAVALEGAAKVRGK
jgi:hypothetical protein